MKMQSVTLATSLILTVGGQALAQQPAAAPATGTVVKQGPAIPGLCVFSQSELVADSKAGQFAAQRFTQIQAQVSADLNATATTLSADQRNLQAQISATSEQANAPAIEAFQQRALAFQTLRDQRADQLQRTKDAAFARVLSETSSFLQGIYESRNCSILIDAESVFVANQSMNITPAIVQALDLKITEFPVELAPVLTQAPAQAAAAPAPAAGAPSASQPRPAGAAPSATTPRQPAGPARAPAGR